MIRGSASELWCAGYMIPAHFHNVKPQPLLVSQVALMPLASLPPLGKLDPRISPMVEAAPENMRKEFCDYVT